ncbi:MAG: hypothetical protein ACI9R3_005060 [Verrucomicrobiales bacterium]|jgi:hypothetical protein
MKKLRRLAVAFSVLGLSLLGSAIVAPAATTWGKWLAIGGGISIFGGWLLLWKSPVVNREADALVQLRREVEREAVRLEKDRVVLRRERALFFGQEQLGLSYDSCADHADDVNADGSDDEVDRSEELVVIGSEDETEWGELDAKVLTLMRAESERLFGNLVENTYVKDGEFDRSRLGDDLIQLMESVALIYKPDSEHPLLETSVERLLHAVNHASVQMLVHLQQLPLDVKSYNLRETYRYLRSGAKFYGYYKRVEPYWSYARPLYHLGRLAMGTNPITIGVGWAVSELIKQGSVNYAHSYALRLFHDTVRILGNEAAGIFGDDYRHRDPAWIYGMEMVGLAQLLPSSQPLLEAALREVTGLTLRSEYDRIFLCGCLAGRASVRPDCFESRKFLSLAERQLVARKIERFLKKQGIKPERRLLEDWKPKVEARLGVHLRIGSSELDPSAAQSCQNALRALASFLIQFKQMDMAQVHVLLPLTQSAANADAGVLDEVLQSIAAEPPMLYEIPILVPGSSMLNCFLQDLLGLEAGHAPRYPESVEAIEETAGYFREDPQKWRTLLRKKYAEFLLTGIDSSGGSARQFPVAAAPLLLGVLQEGEMVEFFFEDLVIVNPEGGESETMIWQRNFVLCATGRRLLLTATAIEESDIIWSCPRGQLTLSRIRGLVSDDCQLSGGRWMIDSTDAPQGLVITGKKLNSYEKRFAPLLAWQETDKESQPDSE